MIDSSVAMGWIMPDEDVGPARNAMARVLSSGGIVPPIFRVEVGNALLVAQRRNRIDAEFSAEALARLAILPLESDAESSTHVWGRSMEIAAVHGLSLYDATYLEVAKRCDLPLATFDKRLAEAAKSEGLAFEVTGR